MLDINHLRKEYRLKSLDILNLDDNPFNQFTHWFEEAHHAQVAEPNAMALATVSKDNIPSCRMILLKGVDENGFLFFSNYDSRKGIDLFYNPNACLTFYWHEVERQIIIGGKTEKLQQKESEIYFSLRPRGSQLGAWASHQGQVLHSRKELEKAYEHYQKLFFDQTIPMPSYWGGYRLIPNRFEFWQGRPDRLHDRFSYELQNRKWIICRLAP